MARGRWVKREEEAARHLGGFRVSEKLRDDLMIDDFIEGTKGGPTFIVSGKPKCYRKCIKRPGRSARPAGWGTDHRGEGACKYHTAATPRGAESPHFKHGRYSKYMKESFAEIVEQLREEIDLESIDEEILTATALFVWHMQQSGLVWLRSAKDILEAVVSFKEKRHRMPHGEKVAIPLVEAGAFVAMVVSVIDKGIADPGVKERIWKRIGVFDAVLVQHHKSEKWLLFDNRSQVWYGGIASGSGSEKAETWRGQNLNWLWSFSGLARGQAPVGDQAALSLLSRTLRLRGTTSR